MRQFILGMSLGLMVSFGVVYAQTSRPGVVIPPSGSGFVLPLDNGVTIWGNNQGQGGTIITTPSGMSMFNSHSTGKSPC